MQPGDFRRANLNGEPYLSLCRPDRPPIQSLAVLYRAESSLVSIDYLLRVQHLGGLYPATTAIVAGMNYYQRLEDGVLDGVSPMRYYALVAGLAAVHPHHRRSQACFSRLWMVEPPRSSTLEFRSRSTWELGSFDGHCDAYYCCTPVRTPMRC